MATRNDNAKDFDFEKIANKMPLVTVIPTRKFNEPLPSDCPELGTRWLRRSQSTADDEERCGLDAHESNDDKIQRYFYAGRADPNYGGVAFAYDASIDRREGDATPFDSGGLCRDLMKPSNLSDDENRKLVGDTKNDLTEWRKPFKEFLAVFFPNPRDYFHGRPRASAKWGPPDLPARQEENTEFIAWTWEARIHEPHPLLDGLLFWAAPHESCRRLKEYASESESHAFWQAPSWIERLWNTEHIDLGPIKEIPDSNRLPPDTFREFEKWIQDRLFGK